MNIDPTTTLVATYQRRKVLVASSTFAAVAVGFAVFALKPELFSREFDAAVLAAVASGFLALLGFWSVLTRARDIYIFSPQGLSIPAGRHTVLVPWKKITSFSQYGFKGQPYVQFAIDADFEADLTAPRTSKLAWALGQRLGFPRHYLNPAATDVDFQTMLAATSIYWYAYGPRGAITERDYQK